MAYPAAAIANEFLRLADENGEFLTQMQVQKLVYFAHGWNLALTGEPLVKERLAAWDYGPVVKSLWKAFSDFGSGPITTRAQIPDWEGHQFRQWLTPSINDGDYEETNTYTRALVRKIWAQYGHLKAFELSELTHIPNSPWQRARGEGREFLRDADIEDYFNGLKSGEITEERPLAVAV